MQKYLFELRDHFRISNHAVQAIFVSINQEVKKLVSFEKSEKVRV